MQLLNKKREVKRGKIEMDFIKQQLEAQGSAQLEQVVEDVQTQNSEEVVAVEAVQEEPVVEETVEQKPTEQVEEVVSNKVKIDVNDWLSSHEDNLFEYLKEKKTDYNSLSPEEIVSLKLRKDNPEFSEEDIKEELADKYGIGLQKKVIDDTMLDEEIEEAKNYNKSIDKKLRQLKKDAPSYLQEFNKLKESLTIPELEYEIQIANEQQKSLTPEEQEQLILEQTKEYREKTWLPELSKAFESVPSVKKNVEFEYNGETYTVEVDYKLSDQEKKEYADELSYYVVNQRDQEKYKDVLGFVQDKVSSLMQDKLLKTLAREVASTVQKKFVKENIVNFDDSGKRQAVRPEGEGDFATNFFQSNSRKVNNL